MDADDKDMKATARDLAAKMRAKEDQLYMAVEEKLFDQLGPLSQKGREGGPGSEWFLAGVCAHIVMCEILRRQIERGVDQMDAMGDDA